jgi:hypothetical protein
MPLTYKRLRVEKNNNKNISNGIVYEKKNPAKNGDSFLLNLLCKGRDFKIISSKQVLTSFITNLGMRARGTHFSFEQIQTYSTAYHNLHCFLKLTCTEVHFMCHNVSICTYCTVFGTLFTPKSTVLYFGATYGIGCPRHFCP